MRPTATDLITAILAPPPRRLGQIDAELLFVAGQYLLHYQQDGGDHYKFLAPDTVRAAFATLPIDTDWLPPSVQRWGTGPHGPWVVTWHPPARYTLEVLLTDTAAPTPLTVPLPGLVWMGSGSTYYLWATAGDHFDPQAPLYRAPLPNVHPDGLICWGSHTPPPTSTAGIQAAWELFCHSSFSAHLIDGKSRAAPGDVRRQLADLAAAEVARYPAADLVAYQRNHAPATVAAAVQLLIDVE
jgi:PRTRC genetic system protein B